MQSGSLWTELACVALQFCSGHFFVQFHWNVALWSRGGSILVAQPRWRRAPNPRFGALVAAVDVFAVLGPVSLLMVVQSELQRRLSIC